VNNLETAVYFQSHIFILVLNIIGNLSLLASVTNVFAVTVDRFLAIRRPYQYMSFATKRRAIIVILTGWGISAFLTVVYNIEETALLLTLGYIVVSLVVTIIIYIYILIAAKKQQSKINGVHGNQNLPSGEKREQKAARTIAIVVGVFIVCWTPFLVFAMLLRNVINSSTMLMYYCLVYSLALCNSAINPYIYCARNSRYRLAFAKLLGRRGGIEFTTSGRSAAVPKVRHIQVS
jgi:histamine receptor H2